MSVPRIHKACGNEVRRSYVRKAHKGKKHAGFRPIGYYCSHKMCRSEIIKKRDTYEKRGSKPNAKRK